MSNLTSPSGSVRSTYNFDSMKLRQKKFILIFIFKLLNSKINSAYMLSKLSINSQKYFNLRNQQLFHIKKDSTKFSPMLNMYRLYNAQNVESSDISHFTVKQFVEAIKPWVSLFYFSLCLFYFISPVMNSFLLYLYWVLYSIIGRGQYHLQY